MITRAKREDKAQLMALFNESFPGEEGFCAQFFNTSWDAQKTLLMREGDRVVSAIHMLYLTLAAGEKQYKASYLYMVGTLKAERGKGRMNELLSHSFMENQREGCDFSSLIVETDSLFAYYSRFGYQKAFFVAKGMGSASPMPAGYAVHPAQPCHLDAMLALYLKAFYEGERLYHKRTAADFALMLSLYDVFVLLAPDGAVSAYAFIRTEGGETTVLEAMGELTCTLVGALAKGGAARVWTPAGAGDATPIGCLRPLSERAGEDLPQLIQTRPYMNLLFN